MDDKHVDGGILVATENGWVCLSCNFTQEWAHPWMKDWSWKSKMGRFPDILNIKG